MGSFLSLHPSSSYFSSSPLLSSFTLSLLFLLSTVQTVGSTVLPLNNTGALLQQRFQLGSTQVDLPRDSSIAPLTQSLVSLGNRQLRGFNFTGDLVQVSAGNSPSLQTSDIAFVPCDPTAYSGNLDADATLKIVLGTKPLAVLLYSTTTSACNYTADQSDYDRLFTLLSADTAKSIETQLGDSNRTGSSYIVPDMASFAPTGSFDDDSGGGGGGSTDSPNTAMIILYSITGIITALFLSIIITGAIRAHRHPERYGPRQRPGRPRQSRARGMARAMLETIPIVKFGDAPDGKLENDKGDVEMSVESEVPASQLREDEQTRQSPMVTGGTTSLTPGETTQNRDATTAPESKEEKRTGIETPTDHPNFSCPICTDDFVKGQDLRVLPCNHQFHPECIDPWLVNVSGTCPLCRIDLNPSQPEGEGENQEGETNAEGQQQDEITNNNDNNNNQTEETQPHRHRRISSYLHSTLNARRMRDASVEERLAALRSVREEANRDQEIETENEERRRRNRLSTRLRERFRIRTRAHGTAADESGAATPAPAATQSQS
ncbi:RING-H2 finger protein [Aspergillus puulaauensis]|uniref:RING-type E3 ubiquitin transferase n=1 Tax=Aspergillus puulaauensis TaxID=1220207 RepID=A0A7R8AI59_9EURO|nr:uncharacterized protein APUU_11138A [Aspergillus puulaauensis]BCS18310.1 hypothetical protein APUU_11138A [Aspergillus puulaauensis]